MSWEIVDRVKEQEFSVCDMLSRLERKSAKLCRVGFSEEKWEVTYMARSKITEDIFFSSAWFKATSCLLLSSPGNIVFCSDWFHIFILNPEFSNYKLPVTFTTFIKWTKLQQQQLYLITGCARLHSSAHYQYNVVQYLIWWRFQNQDLLAELQPMRNQLQHAASFARPSNSVQFAAEHKGIATQN